MSSLSANLVPTAIRSEKMNAIREEAAEHGIDETRFGELLEAWFLEYLKVLTSFGELMHGVSC